MTQLPPTPASSSPTEPQDTRRRIDSQSIFCGASTVEIDHAGQRYLLRVTRENKLILTK